MKVLVLGSGGREHALVWKLRQSPLVEKVYCVPGNGGIGQEAECLPGDPSNVEAMAQLAEEVGADCTVVGPEAPLIAGLVDEFEKRNLAVIGPGKAGAQLEGSKIYSKRFMERHGIPTARFRVAESFEAAVKALADFELPVVIKADGLAAGKGVKVVKTDEEATATLDEFMRRHTMGTAGERVVIEEFVAGEEASFMVLSDGEHILPLAPSQDHKQVLDADRGPNTGGMGAYSEDQIITSEMRVRIMNEIVGPTFKGLSKEGISFRGILYCGLMLTPEGPKLLEYNVRLGDPEAQPILMRLHTDLMELFNGVLERRLDTIEPRWSPDPAICVVMTSAGYPAKPEVGRAVAGIDDAEKVGGVKVFHAGTRLDEEELVSSGGRVLGVTAAGENLQTAIERAYEAVNRIHFEGCHFRRDIGLKGLRRLLKKSGPVN